MSLHKEISFEAEVCSHLGANSWLYAEGEMRIRRALQMVPNIAFYRYQISFKLVKA